MERKNEEKTRTEGQGERKIFNVPAEPRQEDRRLTPVDVSSRRFPNLADPPLTRELTDRTQADRSVRLTEACVESWKRIRHP
jgi:hypothetical protein